MSIKKILRNLKNIKISHKFRIWNKFKSLSKIKILSRLNIFKKSSILKKINIFKYFTISDKIADLKFFRKIKRFSNNFSINKLNILRNRFKKVHKEYKILWFFFFLILILLLRLFRLQVVKADYYEKVLFSQHFTKSLLKAKRWNIYITDKSNKAKALTENIEFYRIYIDPKFVKNKPKLIENLTPLVYEHFCELNWLEKPTKEECIKNIEKFTNQKILPDEDKILSISWDLEEKVVITPEMLRIERQKILEAFSGTQWKELISKQLNEIIKTGLREKNYLGFFDNDKILTQFKEKNFEFAEIVWNYIYIIPSKVQNIEETTNKIYEILNNSSYSMNKEDIKISLVPKENRYVIIISDVNWKIAKELKEMKSKYFSEKYEWVPLLHWIWIEKFERRFYPYWSFMSNIIWYLDKDMVSYFGIEKYFDDILNGNDWEIVWLSVPWIWAIWSNNFQITNSTDWNDIYLTIDPVVQKEVEALAKFYYQEIRPDSLSIMIMNPFNGKIKAATNYPDFDPNDYEEAYKIRPMEEADRIITENDTNIDIPVLILDNDKLRIATYEERKDPQTKKYMFKNIIGPQVFKDKNISMPYEPGSVFKTFTLWIWIDTDEISMYDFYEDKWKIEVWPYTISNVHKECIWTNTFLNSLEWSCNVWMVKIAQKIRRFAFYNYLDKIWLWKRTDIELDWEDPWAISALTDYSLARFYNNSFGQWILVTPIQMLVWYSALVNWWYVVKPTIIDKIYDKKTWTYITFDKKIKWKVFKQSTSENIKESLFKVISEWDLKGLSISWYTLWWKTGTSEIAFKWVYHGWSWWTNASFMWIITREDLRYVISIQMRRPRASQWWITTAWKIFKNVAKLLIENEWITK